MESERSFLRDAERFFAHLFPGVARLHPSSFNRRVKKLRRFLEPLRRDVAAELVGEPETLIVDSTLLSVLHPRQVRQSAGFEGAAWVRWGSFSVYRVKLHLICATNRVPLCYELTAANVAEVKLTEELLTEAGLGEALADCGVLVVTERSRQGGQRQQVEIAFSSLKRIFGIGETLARTLVGLVTRIVAKIAAYTYAFLVNRCLGRPEGRIKELWA